MYLKISSVSITNAVDMFTLGVSTARGQEDKIGQFGTGSLNSTLLWMRRYGVSPVYMLNGVRVSFESRPERTSTGTVFHRVFQTVVNLDGTSVETPLSVALEHGELDWTESNMALREWICNAIDQGSDIVDCISKTDVIVGALDCVEVYVPMNADVSAYWQQLDTYFLHFSNRQEVKVLRKNAPSPCRLYRKGVFVRTLGIITQYDYNLPIDINECRTGSSDSMTRKIENVLEGYADSPGDEYYADIFDMICAGADCWEVKNAQCYCYSNWTPALQSAADRGVRLIRETTKGNHAGYRVDSVWYSALVKLVPSLSGYADVLEADNAIELIPASADLEALADQCWNFLSRLLPNMADKKTKPSVFSFVSSNGQMPDNLGHYDAKLNRVCIWRDQCASVQTVLEEMAHAMSGQRDCTRPFQEYLFRLLTETMPVVMGTKKKRVSRAKRYKAAE